MSKKLGGKFALVICGSRGIRGAIANYLALAGASVDIT